jgi:hypothetical protein
MQATPILSYRLLTPICIYWDCGSGSRVSHLVTASVFQDVYAIHCPITCLSISHCLLRSRPFCCLIRWGSSNHCLSVKPVCHLIRCFSFGYCLCVGGPRAARPSCLHTHRDAHTSGPAITTTNRTGSFASHLHSLRVHSRSCTCQQQLLLDQFQSCRWQNQAKQATITKLQTPLQFCLLNLNLHVPAMLARVDVK